MRIAPLLLALFVACFLNSCAETTLVKADGTVLVNGGVWTKAKGRAMIAEVTMPNGVKVRIRNVTEEPDGVTGPQGLIDGAVTGIAAKAFAGASEVDSNNEAATAQGAQGVQKHQATLRAQESGFKEGMAKVEPGSVVVAPIKQPGT